ncbi:STAS/SEC14 domain-containing protein [Spirosoma spitsbergense]|jgi:hypothetical protein|uniref:STAS/SEC14 domain-containing protein n=1 Tax=Spirosoma spitsbergense TaxID=431554 RepID=UPI000372B9FC|nr:STAS/SEC14 domain-containing protein [Spirosoma spitsbergense]
MITPVKFQSANIIGFRMAGTITEDEIKSWATLLDQKSEAPQKLRVYVEAEDIDDISLDALMADLKFDLTHLGDFEKAAFVSDETWTKLSTFAAGLVPNIKAKQFSLDEKEAAKEWIES